MTATATVRSDSWQRQPTAAAICGGGMNISGSFEIDG